MRLAGYTAVLLSFLLGAGGISVRSHADSVEAASDPVGGMSMLVADPQPASSCYGLPRHQKLELTLQERDPDDLRFTLNSKGHNYVRPGEYRPVPAAPSK